MGRLFLLFLGVFLSVFPRSVQGDITVGGNRPVSVFVPSSYDPSAPTPLIILLHGYGGTSSGVEGAMRFKPLAESQGFLYAAPDGTGDGCGARDPHHPYQR